MIALEDWRAYFTCQVFDVDKYSGWRSAFRNSNSFL
jgi:hypothetical protein